MALSLKQLNFNNGRVCSRNQLKGSMVAQTATGSPRFRWQRNCACFYNLVPQKLLCTEKLLSENRVKTVKLSLFKRLHNSEFIGNDITAETLN